MNKKISIITPTLNQGTFIEECILSVLDQNYQNLQFIIIDGGSTDGTLDVIKRFEKHIDYWVSEKDSGQSHAINKGLKKANGDIVNWLNSDDYLEPGSLSIINNAFENPETNIFSGRSNIVEDGKILKQTRGLDIYLDNLPKTIGLARIDQPETFWKRSVLEKLGPLNKNLHYIMDRDWWIRYLMLFGLNGIINSDDLIANFRLHAESKTVSELNRFNDERNNYFANLSTFFGLDIIDDVLVNKKHNLKLNLRPNTDPKIIKESLNYFLYQLASEYYADSDWQNFNITYNRLNHKWLHKKDRDEFRKLKYRTNILPSHVHRLIKKFR